MTNGAIINPNMFPLIRVIVVNYDGGEITLRCLRALDETNWPKHRLEIVLVDNASVDGLDWRVPQLFPHVKLIKSLTNEGFARGNNLAMQDLDDIDFVALINNDAIPEPDWLVEMYKVAKECDKIAGVSAKMLFNKTFVGLELDPHQKFVCLSDVRVNNKKCLHLTQFDERFDNSGKGAGSDTPQHWFSQICSFAVDATAITEEISEIEVELHSEEIVEVTLRTDLEQIVVTVSPSLQRISIKSSNKARVINNAGEGMFKGLQAGDIAFRELDLGHRNQVTEVFGFCGGVVLLRCDFLRDVGIFDDTFFLYYEDVDLAWRGRLRGWRFFFSPQSVVLHEHSYSSKAGSPFVFFWSDRNRRLTLIKNGPASVAVKALMGAFIWAFRDAVIPPLREMLRLRKPDLRASTYRLRQLGSFLKAVPVALRNRKQIGQTKQLNRDFIYQWISSR